MASGKVAETEEVRPDLILDYDENSKILSIEMLHVSKNVENLREFISLHISHTRTLVKSQTCPKFLTKQSVLRALSLFLPSLVSFMGEHDALKISLAAEAKA
jgi:uncharacterized protein YuzE